jgi:hypothetical protein
MADHVLMPHGRYMADACSEHCQQAGGTHWHVLIALPVTGNNMVALRLEPLAQVRGNEATSASDADFQLGCGPAGSKRVGR